MLGDLTGLPEVTKESYIILARSSINNIQACLKIDYTLRLVRFGQPRKLDIELYASLGTSKVKLKQDLDTTRQS